MIFPTIAVMKLDEEVGRRTQDEISYESSNHVAEQGAPRAGKGHWRGRPSRVPSRPVHWAVHPSSEAT